MTCQSLLTAALITFAAQIPGSPRDFSGVYESAAGDTVEATHKVYVLKTKTGYECQWRNVDTGRLVWLGTLEQKDGQWVEHYPHGRSPSSCPDYGWLLDNGCPVQVARDGTSWWIVRIQ